MLRYGIPAYRMPREKLDKEISLIEQLGVKFVYIHLRQGYHRRQPKATGFDAIFLGVGSQVGQPLGCEGENLCVRNIISGVEFLGRVGSGEKIDFSGKTIMVVGGGNTAIDASRTALRLGAEEVILIYRRGREEMPAHKAEVDDAEYEGVKLGLLCTPKKMCHWRRASVVLTRIQLENPTHLEDAVRMRFQAQSMITGGFRYCRNREDTDRSSSKRICVKKKEIRIVADDIYDHNIDGVLPGRCGNGPKTAIMRHCCGPA